MPSSAARPGTSFSKARSTRPSTRARYGTRSCARRTIMPSRASFSSIGSMPPTISHIARRSRRRTPAESSRLPPYGACLLGSINLARLVEIRSRPAARIDRAKLEARVATAVRFLDNVIDISRYPLDAQAREARAKRRIGLGITGLADALIFLGLPTAAPAAREKAARMDGAHPERRLSRQRRSCRRERRVSALRRDGVSGAAERRAARCGRSRGDRRERHSQRLPDVDRADGHDLAARRQRVERRRTGVRFRLPAPCASATDRRRTKRRSRIMRIASSAPRSEMMRRCPRRS